MATCGRLDSTSAPNALRLQGFGDRLNKLQERTDLGGRQVTRGMVGVEGEDLVRPVVEDLHELDDARA